MSNFLVIRKVNHLHPPNFWLPASLSSSWRTLYRGELLALTEFRNLTKRSAFRCLMAKNILQEINAWTRGRPVADVWPDAPRPHLPPRGPQQSVYCPRLNLPPFCSLSVPGSNVLRRAFHQNLSLCRAREQKKKEKKIWTRTIIEEGPLQGFRAGRCDCVSETQDQIAAGGSLWRRL